MKAPALERFSVSLVALTAAVVAAAVMGQTQAVDVKTVNEKTCQIPFKLSSSDSFRRACTVIGNNGIPRCPTRINANGIGEAFENCQIMEGCSATTRSGKTCKPFSYEGTDYPAGTCAYRDGFNDQPWCATDDSRPFLGAAGQVNWDYCSCSIDNSPTPGAGGSDICLAPPADPVAESSAWQESAVLPGTTLEQPPNPAAIRFPTSGIIASSGARVPTDMMTDPPTPIFDCDPSQLYTYMVEDNGIPGIRYFHYLVYNVADCNFESGFNTAFDWVPSFSFNFNGTHLVDDSDFFHPHAHYIYEQPGSISMDESQIGCDPTLVSARIQPTHEALAAKYQLTLVAGSVIQNPYSGKATDELLCYYTQCTGNPFPAPLSGVNSADVCPAP